jgi:hypothetical protein
MKGNSQRNDAEYIEHFKGLEPVQYWELLKVVELFNKKKIPVMLLKGAIELAVPEYGPPGYRLRAMGDIDFYVRYEDSERAIRILEESSYMRVFALEDLMNRL